MVDVVAEAGHQYVEVLLVGADVAEGVLAREALEYELNGGGGTMVK